MKMKKWLKAILAGAMILGTACAASAEEDEIVLLKKNFSTGAVTECMSVKESQIPDHIVSEGFEGLFPNSDEKDGVQTLSIIGDDNREIITDLSPAPYRSIAKITTTWSDGSKTAGTGWLFSKGKLITRAENLYSRKLGSWGSVVVYFPEYAGTGLTLKTSGSYLPKNYIETGADNLNFGIIPVGDYVGANLGYFGYESVNDSLKGVRVSIAGFARGENDKIRRASGNILGGNDIINYKIDTDNGQGGAPMYHTVNGKYICVGMHTTGGDGLNYGLKITSTMAYFMSQN